MTYSYVPLAVVNLVDLENTTISIVMKSSGIIVEIIKYIDKIVQFN